MEVHANFDVRYYRAPFGSFEDFLRGCDLILKVVHLSPRPLGCLTLLIVNAGTSLKSHCEPVITASRDLDVVIGL